MSATIRAVAIVLTLLAAPALAQAQSRNKTLLALVESGPNSMDIHGVGANFRAYGAKKNATAKDWWVMEWLKSPLDAAGAGHRDAEVRDGSQYWFRRRLDFRTLAKP